MQTYLELINSSKQVVTKVQYARMEGSIGAKVCRSVRSCWAHRWTRSYRRLAPAPATPRRRPAAAAAVGGGIRLGRGRRRRWRGGGSRSYVRTRGGGGRRRRRRRRRCSCWVASWGVPQLRATTAADDAGGTRELGRRRVVGGGGGADGEASACRVEAVRRPGRRERGGAEPVRGGGAAAPAELVGDQEVAAPGEEGCTYRASLSLAH